MEAWGAEEAAPRGRGLQAVRSGSPLLWRRGSIFGSGETFVIGNSFVEAEELAREALGKPWGLLKQSWPSPERCSPSIAMLRALCPHGQAGITLLHPSTHSWCLLRGNWG